ncbi:carbohydrate ABC transporter permease [Paenibacillus sp. J2TS4]|uniref:carbohydrate ABC transporter permease n=1 Tax=Paenibacillus sp. J2TS4 TaxID=2807194 RepID=UPI001B1A6AC5|nr:sugar ABC transporter permease [Paenibacillus sp. J2TS4]GIP36135.1 sugar ABC transporter permease [Paenibacillus sp. J2TS4]
MKHKRTTGKIRPQLRRKYIWAYVFILPQLLYFLLASLYPIVMSYVYSFYEWDGLGPLEKFVGFANYTELLKDEMFWNSFENALIYGVGTTVISVVVSFLLALILNEPLMKGKAVYRSVYFLPVVTTTAIVGVIMNNIFGIQGFANVLLQQLKLISEPIRFWLEPNLAMFLLIIIGSWKHIGVVMIYWLAGLQMIPNDLYEAARIDGANYGRTLWHITIPLLKPVAATILLLTVGSSLHVFDLVKTLTNGGPYHQTETIELFIYQYAFASDFGGARVGYASAAGVWLGLFVLLVSLFFGWLVMKSGGSTKRQLAKGGGRL